MQGIDLSFPARSGSERRVKDLYSLTETIADGFQAAVREGWSSVHVCHFEDELCVLPAGHSFYRHKVFCCFDLERNETNFTSEDWLALLKPIILFYFGDPKCPPNQKLLPSMSVT